MLTHIYIRNFTLVKQLNVDCHAGLSVITGETGAGKSIWVDAISLALGARADYQLIGAQASPCEIILSFDLRNNKTAQQWLVENQLDSGMECIIRRVANNEGSSRSTINDRPCSLYLIRELSEKLLHIHSQHQSYALLRPDHQRLLLDKYAKHLPLVAEVKLFSEQWQQINTQLQQILQSANHKDSQLELLNHEHQELEANPINAEQWQQLCQQHRQLHHSKELIANLEETLSLCQEQQPNISQLIQNARQLITDMMRLEPKLSTTQALFDNAQIQIEEAVSELKDYQSQLNLSPEQLAQLEERISAIHDLARKHHVEPEQLGEVKIKIQQKITELQQIEKHVSELQQQEQTILKKYHTKAQQLTQSRQQAANTLNRLISQQLNHLGMAGGVFKVNFQDKKTTINAYGQETVEFLICTNPGQTLKPLNKVASGGETSRISLALQVATAQENATPTLIFDEVDVGIGGKTAEIVGQLLRNLARQTQVLCITHLPQVAAYGQHHYRVTKHADKKTTTTTMALLDKKQRKQEIARMLGGAKITEKTLQHAQEMLTID